MEEAAWIAAGLPNAIFDQLADHEQRAFKGTGRHAAQTHEDLTEHRQHSSRANSCLFGHGRYVAPTQDVLTFGSDDFIENLLARSARVGFRRQEDLPDAVTTPIGHVKAEPQSLSLEKAVWQLQQDAGAVTGILIGAGSAAMRETTQDLERVVDDGPRFLATHMSDKADATCVMLSRWFVQPPGFAHGSAP